MSRPVTLFTGQWADLTLEVICAQGQRVGLRRHRAALLGRPLQRAEGPDEPGYWPGGTTCWPSTGSKCWAISNHLTGQVVCDHRSTHRHQGILPAGLGRRRAEEDRVGDPGDEGHRAGRAKLGVKVVNGFTGSSIWHLSLSFPPVSDAMIDDGFKLFADRWNPILDVFKEGVKFAPEVHPTEIAFDIYTAERALKAIDHRPEFGFNFDPSHLLWQDWTRSSSSADFRDRIYHVHVKDARSGSTAATASSARTSTSATRAAAGTSSPPAAATSTARRSSGR